ncbi:hypothetical protein [Francisella sp. TX07-6608]|uniref:hypothetical protein n=1 Tax=Francisella sp. TX07-6608 TaxID=573568 RepID=UPI0009242F70|nr:hypothetical protein [Francisella sp. TX07-6608]OIN82952.1 hypothetical protein KX00_2055 [Francisella sp. TX07-6608]
MEEDYKTKMITARVKPEVKEFYDNYRGLASKVLEDFYDQHKTLISGEFKPIRARRREK